MERLDLNLADLTTYLAQPSGKNFESIVSAVASWKGVKLQLNSPEEARTIRRKLYRARAKMKESPLRALAFNLTFKINGSSIEILPPTAISVTQLETSAGSISILADTEDSTYAPENKPATSTDN